MTTDTSADDVDIVVNWEKTFYIKLHSRWNILQELGLKLNAYKKKTEVLVVSRGEEITDIAQETTLKQMRPLKYLGVCFEQEAVNEATISDRM